MVLRNAFGRPPAVNIRVGMHIGAAVVPGAAPSRVVNEHGVPAPVKAAESAPAPWPEKYPERHAEPEADRAADHKARPRREEHDGRVVVRHNNKVRD